MFSMPNVEPLKYARIEEERRFLLKSIPEGLQAEEPFVRIFDHYVPGTRLRLRLVQSSTGEPLVYKFGQKYQTGEKELHQTIMTNIYLNEAEYLTLLDLGGQTISKRRYQYHYHDNEYSIDIFEDDLQGLILAEVEGQETTDISSLPIPGFAFKEVTGDLRFTGGELAKLTAGEFRRFISGHTADRA